MQWVLKHKEDAFQVQIPKFIQEEKLSHDIRYFLALKNLLLWPGKLFQTPDLFLFEYDPGFEHLLFLHDSLPSWIPPSNLERVIITNTLQKEVFELLDDSAHWKWFEEKLDIVGPVSCFAAYSPKHKLNLLLFGDVHDNFNVPGVFSHEDVIKNFKDFFGSADKFYMENADFSHFKFIVEKMKTLVYSPQKAYKLLFIWEYLVCVLHLLNSTNTCVDVIVEDRMHMEYESTIPANYLDAVRYLFSICPMISTLDTPFANFVVQCRELFPNLRYHRIDLRYGLYEELKGELKNETDFFFLAGSLRGFVRMIGTPQATPDAMETGIKDLLTSVYEMDNEDDIMLFSSEIVRAFRQFVRSRLLKQRHVFLDAFQHAIKKHWVPDTTRSKWFFLRTCITDLYGLSRLYRKIKNPEKKHPRQRPTKICRESSYSPKHAICYLGDYHAKVWQDVIRALDENTYVSQNQSNQGTRAIYFEEFTRKPLSAVEWDTPREKFKELMDASDTWKPRGEVQLFLQLMSTKGRRKFFVFYLAASGLDVKKLAEEYPDFKEDISNTEWMWEKREKLTLQCNDTSDAFLNYFADMDVEELNAIYVKPGTGKCYSAEFMYAHWVALSAAHKTFRDPLTRKIISQEEQNMILDITQKPKPVVEKNNTDYFIITLKTATVPKFTRIIAEDPLDHIEYFIILIPDKFLKNIVILHAFKELLANRDTQFDSERKILDHPEMHLANFRKYDRWLSSDTEDAVSPEALKDLQQELLPFINFDW